MTKVKDLCPACGVEIKPFEALCPKCAKAQARREKSSYNSSLTRKELRAALAKLAICLIAAIALLIPLGVGFMAHGLLSFIASLIASIGYTATLIYLVVLVHWLEPEWI